MEFALNSAIVEVSNFSLIKVLIVEDNATMRKLLRSIVDGLGVAHILEADNGVQVLRLLDENAIDVIFLDWKMEPMNGIELAKKIREDKEKTWHTVPIILVSAFVDKDLVLAARDAGINEVLAKPVSAKMIQSKLLSIVVRPREFIKSDVYIGPDRRRQKPTDENPGRRARDRGEEPKG